MRIEPDRTSQAFFDYVESLKRYVAEKIHAQVEVARKPSIVVAQKPLSHDKFVMAIWHNISVREANI
jgi:hypothetical protein